jgi:hypothetical protein
LQTDCRHEEIAELATHRGKEKELSIDKSEIDIEIVQMDKYTTP